MRGDQYEKMGMFITVYPPGRSLCNRNNKPTVKGGYPNRAFPIDSYEGSRGYDSTWGTDLFTG